MKVLSSSKNTKKFNLKKANIVAVLFILPAFVCAIFLRYFPLAKVVYYSFFDYNVIDPPGTFIGFKNYLDLLNQSFFRESVVNTLWFMLLTLIFTFFIPVIQAIFLNEIIDKQRKYFSTIYLLTAVIPISANVILWKWIWNPDNGLANYVLNIFGIGNYMWLSDPTWTKFCIVFPGIVGGGTAVLLYLAAIVNISPDIYEAAQIDGCSGWKKIRYIILPNIKFMIITQLVLTCISTMQILDLPYQFTSGGPAGSSTSIGVYIYKTFQEDLLIGKTNAASVILFIIIAIMVYFQLKLDSSDKE